MNEKTVLIFDCDGVILDSNSLKIKAFLNTIKEYDNEIKVKFIQYVKSNFGKSRYHFFDYLLRKLIGNYKKSTYEKLIKKFSQESYQLYLTCPITKGTKDFLKNSNHQSYIATGSDQNEMINVFKKKSLIQYFQQINGSPRTKTEIIRNILNSTKGFQHYYFIGDSQNDLNACKNFKQINFIYMSEYSIHKEKFSNFNGLKIKNISELISIID
ncbi:MAG: HAD family hydrolase [Halobacteriovoraceae bacterium]|nr:HAD family hydrolase [Halobacteriovoraceae bacterium]